MIIVRWKNEDESKTKTEDQPVWSEDPVVCNKDSLVENKDPAV